MKVETKVKVYSNLSFSILFGVLFTIVGGLLTNGAVDWAGFPLTALVGIAVGFTIAMVLPLGKWGAVVAGKVAKPDTFLFNLVMNAVLLIAILAFMCPILNLFIGSVLMGAPVAVILPQSYALYIPFFLIGLGVTALLGGLIMKLVLKCAGASGVVPASEKSTQEKV
ncbi:hypothetical protein HMPREF0322_01943 [Desulfitobacterium hafniense DP7]|uniref:Uncharacterized protein n=1 Tax=Desulfitobacterium hafniense DP7 TaxID=537010 RepID=G9XLV7_DESHA|nr:hypothetical protein [Desulfitobacterium hafniense]EHL07383.1 hypothetical protein HMPREF0322_01943 [Desulfitobacterium hafniense DP7]